MTPREQAEQIAERIVSDYAHCDYADPCGHCDDMVGVIESALLTARRDALLEAAEAAAAAPEFVFASAIVDWLRARAAEQKEPA